VVSLRKIGVEKIDRSAVPKAIQNTREFKDPYPTRTLRISSFLISLPFRPVESNDTRFSPEEVEARRWELWGSLLKRLVIIK